MSRSAEWILQHGWGFSGAHWDSSVFAASPSLKIKTSDRGYFGISHHPQFDNASSFKVLISHSLGLHFLSPHSIAQADALVVIGGFQVFHPDKPVAKQRSEKILQKMQEGLQKDPLRLLDRFYESCGFVPSSHHDRIEKECLSDDLALLDRSVLDLHPFLRMPKILLLHGRKDTVVPYAKGCELHEMLPQSTLIDFPEGGHALPFTHARDCFAIINREFS